MENQYTISEAKNRLTSIIHSVEKGPSVKLTRRGRPVAILLSIREYEKLKIKKEGFWNALNAFRHNAEKNDITITGEEFENLRDDSTGREVNLS